MLTLKNLQNSFYSLCIQPLDMKGSPYHEFEPSEKYPEKQWKKIGYLGGGQLAQLSALAAQKQWFETVAFLAEGENAPVAQVSEFVEIVYSDTKKAVEDIIDSWVDVVTAEWENVPAALAKAISEAGIQMSPNWRVYDLVQDRATEKNEIIKCIWNDKNAVVEYVVGDKSEQSFRSAFERLWVGRIKTRRLWYDGKGQDKIRNDDELEAYIGWVRWEQEEYRKLEEAWAKPEELEKFKAGRKFVDFDEVDWIFEKETSEWMYEISMMVWRNKDWDVAVFDPSHNKHENGILVESIMPAWESPELDWRISKKVIEEAKQMAILIAQNFGGSEWIVWLVGVEFFVLPDGTIQVNEIAPRPHNSWHTTEYSHDITQFEILNLAITNQKLHTPNLVNHVHLVNSNNAEVLDYNWVNEKTGDTWRTEDKTYARLTRQWNTKAETVIEVDYWKWAKWKIQWQSDEDEVKGVRKRGHMNVVKKLSKKLFEKFKW